MKKKKFFSAGRICAALLLGCVTSYLLALSLALWSDTGDEFAYFDDAAYEAGASGFWETRVPFSDRAPGDWPARADDYTRQSAFGTRFESRRGYVDSGRGGPDILREDESRAGWPASCLGAWRYERYVWMGVSHPTPDTVSTHSGPKPIGERGLSIGVWSSDLTDFSGPWPIYLISLDGLASDHRLIPIAPRPLGLAINTLFYSLVFLALFAAWSAVNSWAERGGERTTGDEPDPA